jgi:hypothetical protein
MELISGFPSLLQKGQERRDSHEVASILWTLLGRREAIHLKWPGLLRALMGKGGAIHLK